MYSGLLSVISLIFQDIARKYVGVTLYSPKVDFQSAKIHLKEKKDKRHHRDNSVKKKGWGLVLDDPGEKEVKCIGDGF